VIAMSSMLVLFMPAGVMVICFVWLTWSCYIYPVKKMSEGRATDHGWIKYYDSGFECKATEEKRRKVSEADTLSVFKDGEKQGRMTVGDAIVVDDTLFVFGDKLKKGGSDE